MRRWIVLVGAGCAAGPVQVTPPGEVPVEGPDSTNDGVGSEDVAVEANFQGSRWFGHFHRGRTGLIGDFDDDGRQDLFVGNPGDPSVVLLNRSEPGTIRLDLGPTFGDEHISWGGALGDFENDGDLDLFVTGGGNERRDWSRMWQNTLAEEGTFTLVDRSEITGVLGPPDESGDPIQLPSAHANAADFDGDGRLDLFVNVDIVPASKIPELAEGDDLGQNVLWMPSGGGYVDRALELGIDSTEASQNSVSLDFDGDGDVDLYENTNRSFQHLWRNLLVETGELRFEDVTAELGIGGADLRYPLNGFASAVADFNLDGWEDVLVFVRAFEPEGSPFRDGHVLLLNVEGRGFVDVAPLTGINEPYVNWNQDTLRDHSGGGVMGSNVGDVNADGLLDVMMAQGGPSSGTSSIFQLSTGLVEVEVEGVGAMRIPQWEHRSDLVDWPAPVDPTYTGDYPPYPYRGHAVNFVDLDRNGTVEILQINGGPAVMPDIVREPNRLYTFTLPEAPRWFAVTLVGNGTSANRSAIGSRVAARVRRASDGAEWTVTRWLRGGNGFAANNGFELYFGLGDADEVLSVDVTWPDGTSHQLETPPAIGDLVQVLQNGARGRDELRLR